MTLPEIEELTDHWLEFPPAHLSLRRLSIAMAGWTPPEPKSKHPRKPSSEEEVRAFLAAVNGA